VQVTHAGDGSGRLFVVERQGAIRIIKNGAVLATPFLDITGTVRDTGDEEGLLSVAFHPNYESNGFLYVYYNNNAGNIEISRYTVSGNPDVANPGSAAIVLTIPHLTNSNHNGGQLMFSPLDGYLYAGTGDGGSSNDPLNNAQNINSLLGKMLRLNVTGVTTYTIPAGNPYAGPTPGADEIWDLGLRNPFRFSFDQGDSNGNGKGDLYLGDVGQNAREEISYHAAATPGGVNFGWRCKEGNLINTNNNINNLSPCNNAAFLNTLTNPIAEYNNPDLGRAVTGGFVYRGNLYPALKGYYFYADFSSGRIWSMTKAGSTFSTPQVEINNAGFNISAFGEDEQGELYVVGYNGSIYRVADVNGPALDLSTSQKFASAFGIDPGETLTYTILIKNTGSLTSATVFLTDRIPAGLSYVSGSLQASTGTPNPTLNPILRWQGSLPPTNIVTVTYQVTASGAITGLLINQAVITSAVSVPITRTYPIFVPRPSPFYFPLFYK
jgi:uncharacterized repeat protein (TIGR01451 family)